MKVKSIRTRIILVVVEVAISMAVVLGGLSIYFSRQISTEETKDTLQLMNQIQQVRINSLLEKMEQTVDGLSAMTLSTIEDFERFKKDTSYEEACTNKLKVPFEEAMLHTDGAFNVYVRYNPEFTNPTSGLFLDCSSGKVEYLETNRL